MSKGKRLNKEEQNEASVSKLRHSVVEGVKEASRKTLHKISHTLQYDSRTEAYKKNAEEKSQ